MRLAIMQPYFLPYIGYFSLFYHSDEFVFFDSPQYTKKSWYERNRIIKINGGSTYIKVPIDKVKIGTSINDVKINNSQDWKGKIFSQLNIYRKAPYYKETIGILDTVFKNEYEYLYLLNIDLIKAILSYLELDKKIHIYSNMDLEIDEVKEPDEWALNISKAMDAKVYINSPGGASFFDKEKYNNENIDLKFIDQDLKEYKQLAEKFEPGLSIIDVLMHNDKHEIVSMLNSSKLI